MKILNILKKFSFSKILIFLELVALIFFLIWHYRLGITRYFDVDEYAHLHWGYSLSIGEKPYTGFFYIFPPFFLYPIAAIFKIFGRTAEALIAGRVFIWMIFLATSFFLVLLGTKMRNLKTGILAAIVFAFIPLPTDKLLEIRPDLPALLFSLVGLYFFILGDGRNLTRNYFISGLFYALSLCIVPKTVFFLVPPMIILGFRIISENNIFRENMRRISVFILGLMIPTVILLFMLFSYGNFRFSWYSMTALSSESAKVLGAKFYMRPDIFFYPNQTFYGFGGFSMQYYLNLIIYVIGALFAIHRFISTAEKEKRTRELMFGMTFFANLYAFVYIFPLKHAQYLIPLAFFISYYFADFIIDISRRLKLSILRAGILIAVLITIVVIGDGINTEKLKWTNHSTGERINYLTSTLPANAAIFDLTGETVVFRNGYYFCCLPYGQYEEAFRFRTPNIEREMQQRDANYVYKGVTDRLKVLPYNDARYITENFVPIVPDGSLLKRK
jgi:hypothetical protein